MAFVPTVKENYSLSTDIRLMSQLPTPETFIFLPWALKEPMPHLAALEAIAT
ncbi:hypothetical protein A2U01_0084106, partial [Trifolium medium]|nr:hypothetical protein [Trifolium medium]